LAWSCSPPVMHEQYTKMRKIFTLILCYSPKTIIFHFILSFPIYLENSISLEYGYEGTNPLGFFMPHRGLSIVKRWGFNSLNTWVYFLISLTDEKLFWEAFGIMADYPWKYSICS
jgi:hypothetical protein